MEESYDLDADLDNEEQDVNLPANLNERRRTQKARFEEWLVSDAATDMRASKASSGRAGNSLEEGENETLSLKALMAKQSTTIVKNPRDYQVELFERAKKENTIAVLDTGTGKTLIAVLLLRWVIDEELERRATEKSPKIAFFLSASVPLVFQQSSVLESNLDHSIIRIYGAMRCDNWSKETWLRHFMENKVIVCTADILQQCLRHGFITMKQINLLVFDEAHHAKRNHAYARIMKDFYFGEGDEERPRIFGMTASPVDAKVDVVQAARELESILDSRIATASSMSFNGNPGELRPQICKYQAPLVPFVIPLVQDLIKNFGHIDALVRRFEHANDLATELGSWCAERYIYEALSETRLRRYEIDIERSFRMQLAGSECQRMESEIANLRKAIKHTETRRPSETSEIDDSNVSDKIRQLLFLLRDEFATPSSTRCIVFVEARRTARLLDAVCKQKGYKHLRSGFVVGTNKPELDEDNFTNRQQVLTLANFRKGDINCLFATSVAEEGLDVTDCNVVIRFDMCRTMIQYIQSRGRARRRNSRFVQMAEEGNAAHVQMVRDIISQEKQMRRFCEQIPEDRLIVGNEDIREALMEKEKTFRVYVEQSTGAKLTYHNALACLAHFVSAIPVDHNETLHPTYVVTNRGQNFVAEVVLPDQAPIASIFGTECSRKLIAKCSAAFNACYELRNKQLLNEWLMPVYQKKLPAMRNALLAKGLEKKNRYLMRSKPELWSYGRGTIPTQLWATMLDFTEGLDRQHRRLILLTRTQMPQFPDFPVFLNSGKSSIVRSAGVQMPFKITEATFSKLACFTFRVFEDVFSKVFESSSEQLSYWLAPMLPLNISNTQMSSTVDTVIDWETVEATAEAQALKWTPRTAEHDLLGRFIVDPWHGGRKFFSISISRELKPSDPVPEDCEKHKWNANILDYSCSKFKNSRTKMTWTANQPVIEAEKIPNRRNMLATPERKDMTLYKRATLCPEPLRISTLPPDVVTSCLAFPAVIHRLESYLVAREACNLVDIKCDLTMALAAITKDSDISNEQEEQGHMTIQRGMGKNYERLEFMGDCFLKTATTISTFIQNPNSNELEFHVKRMLLLCNKNLYEVATKLQLFEYIRSKPFSRRSWYPESLKLVQGKGANKESGTLTSEHSLSQKTIADVSEALIGAAFMAHNRPDAWHEDHWENAISAVTKFVGSDDHLMLTWDDYRKAYLKPDYQVAAPTASQLDLASKVESEHDYHFTYPRLLRSAFIHPSQPRSWEDVPNYQRLEFLGDALLDMACISYLFYKYPDKDEQWLTEHKMAMVSNKFLGACCVDIGFHRHLRFNSPVLPAQIQAYETELLEAKRLTDGKNYWTTISDPPKCLPDIVESYVGAMFIDSNFDWNQVQRFFDAHIKNYFVDMSIYDSFANDHPCTRLYSLIQTTYRCQEVLVVAKELPAVSEADKYDVVAAVMIHNEVVACSKGTSGRYSRERAAKMAAERVEGMALFEFRATFGCNCVPKSEDGLGDAIDWEPSVAYCNA